MNVIEINDINAPEVYDFAKASESELFHANEPHGEGYFIAESPYVITLAIEGGYEPVCFLVQKSMLSHELIKNTDLPIYTADDSVLAKITGFNLTFGMLCKMKRKKNADVEIICKNSKRIAVLEHIMNPTNVGAIMRSAAALGIDALLLTADCSDPLYRRAARVSMGTVFKIPWAFFDNKDYIKLLKSHGFCTLAMALDQNSVSLADERIKAHDKIAVVLGSEGEGLCKDTIANCDYTVKIPMYNGVDSLNVAAASAVTFWELGK